MIYDTSVTTFVVSPNMTKSKWIDWEIAYSLRNSTREGRASKSDGILGVIAQVEGGYDWIETTETNADGCRVRVFDSAKLYKIITKNRFNLKEPVYSCPTCKSVNSLTGSYISLVQQDTFYADPAKYIEILFKKSRSLEGFDIHTNR